MRILLVCFVVLGSVSRVYSAPPVEGEVKNVTETLLTATDGGCFSSAVTIGLEMPEEHKRWFASLYALVYGLNSFFKFKSSHPLLSYEEIKALRNQASFKAWVKPFPSFDTLMAYWAKQKVSTPEFDVYRNDTDYFQDVIGPLLDQMSKKGVKAEVDDASGCY